MYLMVFWCVQFWLQSHVTFLYLPCLHRDVKNLVFQDIGHYWPQAATSAHTEAYAWVLA